MNGYGVLITKSGVRLGGEWVNDKPGSLTVLHESSDVTDTETENDEAVNQEQYDQILNDFKKTLDDNFDMMLEDMVDELNKLKTSHSSNEEKQDPEQNVFFEPKKQKKQSIQHIRNKNELVRRISRRASSFRFFHLLIQCLYAAVSGLAVDAEFSFDAAFRKVAPRIELYERLSAFRLCDVVYVAVIYSLALDRSSL